MRKEWIAVLVGTMTALVLAIGGTWIFTQTSQAEAAELIQPATSESEVVVAEDWAPASQLVEQTIQSNNGATFQNAPQARRNVAANQAFAPRSNRNRGDQARPGFRGGPRGQIDHEALLADALGITVEELQAAHESARQAGIQQAVEEGLITQEQADQMLAREGRGPRGGRGFGGRGGKFGSPNAQIDHQALLADALGITVEQLEAAHEEARAAATQQALDEGLITQEQADMMAAHQALKEYIDHEAILAQALGISVADLQAAREEGKSMRTLIDELGLDHETLHANMQAAHEAAIQQAVTDGVITQAQADQILADNGRGFGGPRGRGGPGGKGDFRGGPGMRGAGPQGRFGGEFDGNRGNFTAPRGNGSNLQNAPTIPASDA